MRRARVPGEATPVPSRCRYQPPRLQAYPFGRQGLARAAGPIRVRSAERVRLEQ